MKKKKKTKMEKKKRSRNEYGKFQSIIEENRKNREESISSYKERQSHN